MKHLAICIALTLSSVSCGVAEPPVIMSSGQTAPQPQNTNCNCHADYHVHCVNYMLQPCGYFVYNCSNGLTYSCLSEIQARYLLRRAW